MRKILLFAVLLLTLTLLPTVPIVADKPSHAGKPGKPPPEETYSVTFNGPDIKSDELELMSYGISGKGGKHLGFLTPQGQGVYSTFTFDGKSQKGKISLSINLKFKTAVLVIYFDYTTGPLDFWRLKSIDKGEWMPVSEGADEGIVSFSNDEFELWKYTDQGTIITHWLTFTVTITKPTEP